MSNFTLVSFFLENELSDINEPSKFHSFVVATRVRFLQGVKEELSLFVDGLQTYFSRQFRYPKDTQFFTYLKVIIHLECVIAQSVCVFLPCPRATGFLRILS